MSSPKNEPEARPWYQEPWVWLIVAFPAAAIISSLVMAYLAFSTDDGLVVDDYYRKGLAINRILSRDHAASRLQLKAAVRLSADGRSVTVNLEGHPTFHSPESL
ncbi:MAG: hypothetical protein DRQ37_03340, partial [Gammaproteobacteria bacterium]